MFFGVSLQCFSQIKIDKKEILILNDSIKLAGTLTYHKNLKKQPLVIFIPGSGSIDRDGNQKPYSNANYIKYLAKALHQNDIAFFRYDKRTANIDNAKFLGAEIVIEDFVKDVNKIIDHFKANKHFSSINIIGHSQGSLVGMLCDLKNVDNYISLAGPSKTIDKTLYEQIKKINGDTLAHTLKTQLEELKTNGSIKNVNPSLFGLLNPTNQRFLYSWMKYDPKKEISKIKISTLILNGDKDLQVTPIDAESLHHANKGSKLVLIKNMNHVLKHIYKEEDNLKSYTNPEFTLSKALVYQIVLFIKSSKK